MNKINIAFVSILILCFSCSKEVGKEPYELIFQFASGEHLNIDLKIYEKPKTYEGEDEEKINITNAYDRLALVSLNSSLPNELNFSLYKTENKELIGLFQIEMLQVPNASFASNQNVNLLGSLNLNGSYKKNGRKYSVENGTFKINWTNAPDYGEPMQELTGTWSLKRK